jgi:hypothetical protein
MELFPSTNPSLPPFFSLAYLYFTILLSSFLITFDLTRFSRSTRKMTGHPVKFKKVRWRAEDALDLRLEKRTC